MDWLCVWRKYEERKIRRRLKSWFDSMGETQGAPGLFLFQESPGPGLTYAAFMYLVLRILLHVLKRFFCGVRKDRYQPSVPNKRAILEKGSEYYFWPWLTTLPPSVHANNMFSFFLPLPLAIKKGRSEKLRQTSYFLNNVFSLTRPG